MSAGLKRPFLLAIRHLQCAIGTRRLRRLLHFYQPHNQSGDDQQQGPPLLDGTPLRRATEIKDTKFSKRPSKADHDERGSSSDISNKGLKLWGGHFKFS